MALQAVDRQAFAVDPALRDAAYVFAAKLNWRVNGTLLALSEREGEVEARWTSAECDWTESEILDLVDTIHREFDGNVRRIVGVRECGGTRRRYSLAGRSFAMYHDGKVSRPEVLKYLIDVHSGE